MKKYIVSLVACFVLAAGVGFYGGSLFSKNQNNIPQDFANRFNSNSLIARDFQGVGERVRAGGGSISGSVFSIDGGSMIIQLINGGSKIVYFSDLTEVIKSVDGTIADLTTASNVFVAGTTNEDDSITATSIQIRPELPKEIAQ
jgi:hypothetical protein